MRVFRPHATGETQKALAQMRQGQFETCRKIRGCETGLADDLEAAKLTIGPFHLADETAALIADSEALTDI